MTTEQQVTQALNNPVPSRHHNFGPGEWSQYNSLKWRGRTLYDNLRTQFDWPHDEAFTSARLYFGVKGDYLS